MNLIHGTDNEKAVEAWKIHNLKPSEFDIRNYEDYDETGDVIESETQREFHEKGLNEVVYLSRSTHFYGQVANIHINVPDDYIVQVGDDEYVMDINAPYSIEKIEYGENTQSQKRDKGGRW